MKRRRFELTGLDGTNPLGFLAAVGTLASLVRSGESEARLGWGRRHTWIPFLETVLAADEEALVETIAGGLRGEAVSQEAERRRRSIREQRRDRREAAEAELRDVAPLEAALRELGREHFRIRRNAVPRGELALGDRVKDATVEEYRELAQALLERSDCHDRDAVDHLAALGTDACVGDDNRLEATPFEFTPGSGHQYFLRDVRQLVRKVTGDRIRAVLWSSWTYRDEGLSLRWDPLEDRRYALLDGDPSDSRARSVWMANLLAYRALAVYPVVASRRGLAVPGWARSGNLWTFTWPLWEDALGLEAVRTVIGLSALTAESLDVATLRARGVAAVYRATRIEVRHGANRKLNFTPARQVFGGVATRAQ